MMHQHGDFSRCAKSATSGPTSFFSSPTYSARPHPPQPFHQNSTTFHNTLVHNRASVSSTPPRQIVPPQSTSSPTVHLTTRHQVNRKPSNCPKCHQGPHWLADCPQLPESSRMYMVTKKSASNSVGPLLDELRDVLLTAIQANSIAINQLQQSTNNAETNLQTMSSKLNDVKQAVMNLHGAQTDRYAWLKSQFKNRVEAQSSPPSQTELVCITYPPESEQYSPPIQNLTVVKFPLEFDVQKDQGPQQIPQDSPASSFDEKRQQLYHKNVVHKELSFEEQRYIKLQLENSAKRQEAELSIYAHQTASQPTSSEEPLSHKQHSAPRFAQANESPPHDEWTTVRRRRTRTHSHSRSNATKVASSSSVGIAQEVAADLKEFASLYQELVILNGHMCEQEIEDELKRLNIRSSTPVRNPRHSNVIHFVVMKDTVDFLLYEANSIFELQVARTRLLL